MIKREFEDIDDFGEKIMKAEIEFDKPVLRNGAKHCKHFFIVYKTEEELQAILNEFSFEDEILEEVYVEPENIEEKEQENNEL